MKPLTLLLLNASLVSAHWVTSTFIFNNQTTTPFEYVRAVSPNPSIPNSQIYDPNTDPDSADLICGRNASRGWLHPKVATVTAGDQVGFFVGVGLTSPPSMYHPGFASAWLSRVEDAGEGGLDGYQGEGGWYKIHQTAGRTSQSVDFEDPANKPYYDSLKALWGTFRSTSWNFTIPASTPAGKYLVRWEHIFPNPQDSQFYVNCAHVEIIGNKAGVEPDQEYKVKIPGVYTRGQEDVYFFSYDYGLKGSLDGFVPPKPDVWQG
ncbi:lytic polysaccharide monooxygenase [Karstenula rhodostoma CBS 690.94]|uniref:AA9 family lytic polysaccharide monooxygenase n=1 Tax=Karstenula rhodostoma CBS 690.94 TaxID=1392251 RepID=A0A9P4PKG8_9PLEO|nr:lytic polysaccharide monooxygenase [Karstenula rhodostoma CBS 690.94]